MTDLGAITNIQADIQKVLKPGVWLPLLRRPHNYEESWSTDADVATFIEDVKKSVKALETTTHDDGSVYKLSDATADHIVVSCFTKSRWMDLVEIKATSKEGKTTATVFGYSTGFLPLSIPGAALLNPFLCWFPFDDFEKPKLVWLPAIRKGITVEVTVEEKGRQW